MKQVRAGNTTVNDISGMPQTKNLLIFMKKMNTQIDACLTSSMAVTYSIG